MNIIRPGSPDELEGLGLDPRKFGLQSTADKASRKNFDSFFYYKTDAPGYEFPNRPLDIEVLDCASGLGIGQEQLDALLAVARWQIPPPFTSSKGSGRSSWIPCKSRIVSTDLSHSSVYAFKIKGIGAVMAGKARPPCDERYYPGMESIGPAGRLNVVIFKEINPDGSFSPVLEPPKPIGGTTLARAQLEFENAKILWMKGRPAVRPVAYGNYPSLKWQGEPMGFVILALPSGDHRRVGELFESEYDETFNVVRNINPYLRALVERCYDTVNPGSMGVGIFKTIRPVLKACGSTLRGFHEAGLARFPGHTGNFSYDQETKIAIQHDLDSSLALDSLGEGARGLYIIRDIETALFGLWHSLVHSQIFKMADKEVITKGNPFKAFLEGYFGEGFGPAVCLAEKLLDEFWRTIREMPEYGTFEWTQYFGRMSEYVSDNWTEYLMGPYNQSPLAAQYPLPYGPGEVYRGHVARFAQERGRMHAEEVKRRFPNPMEALGIASRIRRSGPLG